VGRDNGNPDAELRRASIEAATESFWQAAEVGAEIVICHANTPAQVYTPDEFEENWALSRDSLAILAERAREAGVKIALENLPRRGMPRPGSSVAEVLKMIEGLGDNVGVCIDAGHSNANAMSAAQDVLEAGERLFSLHIQDNDGLGSDQHLVPGRGSTDWEAFLQALDVIDFAGSRTFEVVALEDAEEKLRALVGIRLKWESR
jgi:sugar phosphate isomerase/epimerase